ncbi:uncharacterized protein LOC143416174 [Maylandia zebra]|uniref:uncharacterized protein LOC143416174 n=1 Tax=Maylandia zebra TaxID=106582 RepID=UPI00403C26F7
MFSVLLDSFFHLGDGYGVVTHHFFKSIRPRVNQHDTVPAKAVKFDLAAAGLGEKRISFQGRDDDPEVVKAMIEDTFPQLKDTGGFELLRISGTTRSRNLCTIPSPDTGYTVRYLRSPLSGIGQALIYIRPLQKSIDLEDSLTTLQQQGPPTKCLNCDINIPLNKMKNHITKCTSSLSGAEPQSVTESQARQTRSTTARSEVPSCSNSDAWNLSCGVEEPDSIILESTITSARAEQSSSDMVVVQEDASHQDEEKSLLGEKPEWKCEQDATRAAWLYKSELLSKYETRKAVVLQMDLRESIVDQQRSLISLYKAPKVEWAGPVSCKLEGDVAVGEGVKRFFFSKAVSLVQSGLHLNFGNTDLTRLFDGEPKHLTPSTSQTLLESDMFLVAGRIMGHSFIHGGPCVSGISPAIIHVLFGGSPETATVQIEDCPDIDFVSNLRTVSLMHPNVFPEPYPERLSPENRNSLCVSWTPQRRMNSISI